MTGEKQRTFKLSSGMGLLAILLGQLGIFSTPVIYAADIGAVCDGPAQANMDQQQRQQYCDAAKSSKSSANANGIMWKVWAGVATVCTAACAATLMGQPWNQWVCTGTSLAGTGVDAVVTKNLQTAMMGILGAGGSYMINRTMNKGETPKVGADGKTKRPDDYGSCFTAATSALQTMQKKQAQSSDEGSVNSNLEMAQQLGNSPAAAYRTGGPEVADTAKSGGLGMSVKSAGMSPAQATLGNIASACGSGAANGNSKAQVACALAMDGGLPSFVSSPKFASDFQKASGQSLSDFLNSPNDNAKAALAGAMGGSLSNSQNVQLASALNKAEKEIALAHPVAGTTYAGGGGGGYGGGKHSDPTAGFGNLMQGLMGKMNGTEEARHGTNQQNFRQVASLSPDAIVEDRRISLFQRITQRYSQHQHELGGVP